MPRAPGSTERIPVKREHAITHARFEDTPAWQEAVRLAEGVYDRTEGKG
jgi:hypothetical protein